MIALPKEDQMLPTKEDEEQLAGLMGGRVAESISIP